MLKESTSPSVFDAGLPVLEYDATATPAQVYPRLRQHKAGHRSHWGHSGPS